MPTSPMKRVVKHLRRAALLPDGACRRSQARILATSATQDHRTLWN
jgi:hypothetical protein